MANQKVTDLTEELSPSADDVLYLVTDTGHDKTDEIAQLVEQIG